MTILPSEKVFYRVTEVKCSSSNTKGAKTVNQMGQLTEVKYK